MSRPSKRYDVCAGRPYKTRDGEDKKQWIKLGELTEWDDGGLSLRLDVVPTGTWFDGSAKVFPKDEDGGGRQQQSRSQGRNPNAGSSRSPMAQAAAPAQAADDFDDPTIPF